MNARSMTKGKEHNLPLTIFVTYAIHKLHPTQEWNKCLSFHDLSCTEETIENEICHQTNQRPQLSKLGGRRVQQISQTPCTAKPPSQLETGMDLWLLVENSSMLSLLCTSS